MMAEHLPPSLPERLGVFLDRIQVGTPDGRKGVRRGQGDSYMACCPAHDDHSPSLSVTLEGPRVLVHCFAGCSLEDICGAVGFPVEALFDDYRNGNGASGPVLVWNRELKSAAREWAGTALDPVERMALPPPIREFLDLDFPPIEPLLGPISTQQIVLLYAPPGAGKTMFALGLAWAIANGLDFVGWTAARKARVLVVDGEMAGQMMQSRLAHTTAEDGWLYVANLANWAATAGYEPVNLCTDEGQETARIWINGLGAEVVVLDNLMSLAWMDGMSMSSDEFWQPIRRFAVAMRAQGVTVIVVDHTNAQGEIFGTKTKLWHADLAMQLSPMGGDEHEEGSPMTVPRTRFQLKFAKVRETPDGAGQTTSDRVVEIGAVGQDWTWSGGKEEQRQRAREMKTNGLTIRDIAEELKTPKSTVGRWVRGL